MRHFLALLLGMWMTSLASAQTLVSETGSFVLPSHGSVGVTLKVYALPNSSDFYWYKRTNSIDVQVSTNYFSLTVFTPGEYWVKFINKGPSTSASIVFSNIVTVLAETPSQVNKVVTTTFIHEGIKNENDMAAPYAGSHGINSITYTDALGRTVQTVDCQASPSKQDIIQPIVYDNYGRSSSHYLPYTGTNTGTYHANAVSEQAIFYATTGKKYAVDAMPYSKTVYENSPSSLVLEQGGVGSMYQPNPSSPSTAKTTKYSYRSNTLNEVASFVYNETTFQITGTTCLPSNTLSVEEVTDPEGRTSLEYKNTQGLLVMSRSMGKDGRDTYNTRDSYPIYDSKGRLVFNVPFMALSKLGPNYTYYSFNKEDAVCKGYMHYYQYDALDRPWYHRAPGAEPVYTVYDRMNRPILTQDGEQRKNNQWSFVKFDISGRIIYSGLYTNSISTTQAQLQALANAETIYWEQRQSATSHGYSESNAFPRAGTNITYKTLTVNYYDDYNFDYDNNNANGTADATFNTWQEMDVSLPIPDYNVYGRATASKSNVIGSTEDKWLWNVSFFDEMGRVIQTRSNSHVPVYTLANGLNAILTNGKTFWLDFTGKVLNSTEKQVNGAAFVNYTIKNVYTYDHMGRLLKESHQHNMGGATIKELKYNELGQLVEKNLNTHTGIPWQSLDYTYNSQGRLTHLNNPELNNGFTLNANNNDDINDFFGLQLYYEQLESGFSALPVGDNSRPVPVFDGKVSGVKWRINNSQTVASKKDFMYYTYLYNNEGEYYRAKLSSKVNSTDAWTHNNNRFERIDTDQGGNSSAIFRCNSTAGVIDYLSFTYEQNKLLSVTESSTLAGGFTKNPAVTGTAYLYNANGSLIEDKNKGLTIEYNHLNLVSKITWKDKTTNVSLGTIDYIYGAGGTMLQKILKPTNGVATKVDYIDDFYYENNTLKFFNHSEGRVFIKTSSGRLSYEYEIKDHQGFSRIKFADDNNDGTAEVIQENHFYPSGMPWENTGLPTLLDKYLLQDKEYLDEGFGGTPLAWYDFGARMYDPSVARWWAQDPLYQYANPYSYCGNDPVNGYDPNGMWNIWDDFRTGSRDLGNWAARNESSFMTAGAAVGVVAGAALCIIPGGQGLGAPLLSASASYLSGYGNARQQGYGGQASYQAGMQSLQFSFSGSYAFGGASPSYSAYDFNNEAFRQNTYSTPNDQRDPNKIWKYIVQTSGNMDVGHAYVVSPKNIAYEVNHSLGRVSVKSMGYRWDINPGNKQDEFMTFNGGRAPNFQWASVYVPESENALAYFESHANQGWDYNLGNNNCKHFTMQGLQAGGAFVFSSTGPIPINSPVLMPYALTPYRLP